MTEIEIQSPAALWDGLAALMAYGGIDGRRFVVDADRTAQLIAPRQQQAWSQSYKARVEKLREKSPDVIPIWHRSPKERSQYDRLCHRRRR